MNESDFLANIARKLGRPQPLTAIPPRSVVGAPDFWSVRELPLPERIERFQQELEKLGGQVTVYNHLSSLKAGLADLLSTLQPRRVGTWGGNALAAFELDDVLAPYDTIGWREGALAAFEQVDVGITGCAYAVADTGTLVMKSDPWRGRSVSVLPTVHVALVQSNQVFTRLGEVLEELAKERACMASSVHFITGPSRSSDIENDQTIGIHGPAAVHVLMLHEA
ncbi:lactate utilization protein C [Alicyclobacillus contaminans]|uniref:LutC/YkgG family protein n=1 Tax=Alicyclobacillus contaminans TaxID=392016 RepID=UPI0003F503BA|nr:LUD domain-containing protein [Alicyclobacillus contaminans]GMA51771.1 lactate utilization protein C [Alicyclobacillus contaminans]